MFERDVVVGLGINPEVSASYAPGSAQKLPAKISMQIAGTAVNVAFNLRQWNYEVELIGAIGQQCPYREFLASALAERGVSGTLLPIKEQTSIAIVCLPENGYCQILSEKSHYVEKPIGEISLKVSRLKPKFIVATGVIPEEGDLAEAMLLAKCENAQAVLNPRRILVEDQKLFTRLLGLTDILAVNEEEFCGFSGNGHVSFEDMVKVHQFGPQIVLVTRDARGAMLTTAPGLKLEQPAICCGEAVDEVGAGDCFLSYFIHGRLAGLNLADSMKQAALAAGVKVTKVGGSSVPTREEILNAHCTCGV